MASNLFDLFGRSRPTPATGRRGAPLLSLGVLLSVAITGCATRVELDSSTSCDGPCRRGPG